jgi:hypothetical protein
VDIKIEDKNKPGSRKNIRDTRAWRIFYFSFRERRRNYTSEPGLPQALVNDCKIHTDHDSAYGIVHGQNIDEKKPVMQDVITGFFHLFPTCVSGKYPGFMPGWRSQNPS